MPVAKGTEKFKGEVILGTKCSRVIGGKMKRKAMIRHRGIHERLERDLQQNGEHEF